MADSHEKRFQKCISALKNAQSDNEKVAALLLVTKLIKSEEVGKSERSELIKAIGLEFIFRLLISKNLESETPDYSYQHLAVSVLACFSTDDEFIASPYLPKTLNVFKEIIDLFDDIPEENGDKLMIDETYECLTCLANRTQGREHLLERKFGPMLCSIIVERRYGHQHALEILLYLLHYCGHEVWDGCNDSLHELMKFYVFEYLQRKDNRKFEVSTIITELLSTSSVHLLDIDNNEWKTLLHDELFKVIQNKLGSRQRDSTLMLGAQMVKIFGVTWMMNSIGTNITLTKKTFMLMVHLVCIEIRVTLEDKTFEQIEQRSDVLCACYTLLESIIIYLTRTLSPGLEQWTQQALLAMVGAFNSIIRFLDNVATENFGQEQCLIVLASIRVLGAWIAEETAALQDEVVSVLPFILRVGRQSYEQDTPLEDCDNRMTSDDTDSAKVTSQRMSPVTNIIKFIVPGLCHLTADDIPRKVFLEEDGHVLVAQYFNDLTKRLENKVEPESSQSTLCTVCGLFMNLAVLEPDLVTTHIVFKDLLSYILQAVNLFDKQSYMVLKFNFAVLGLMLLRHQSSKKNWSMDEAGKFILDVIDLISDAHKINEKGLLVCQDSYGEHWCDISEMWFLSMQSISTCISLIPWMSCIIIKSEWIQKLLSLLKSAKSGTVSFEILVSYKRFLCEIASNSEEAMQLMRDKGVQKVARLHGLQELVQCTS